MSDAFLNVNKSLSNRFWLGPSDSNDRKANALAQSLDVSYITGLLLSKHNLKYKNN